jgi:hypothetical protein
MFDLANLSLDIIILLLRVAVVFLLYFFLWQVLRSVVRSVGAGAGAASASPYGQLIVVRSGQSGMAAGKAFPLGPSTIIGRSMDQCEIALNDSFLSAQHARLELRGDEWVLEDLNSTNGTFVNDVEVRDAALVEDGDVIRIGRVELKLVTRA